MAYIQNRNYLKNVFMEAISNGLTKKNITTCSKWAETYRILPGSTPYPGPWTFKWHPWLRDMHDSKAELNVGQKSAQMGYSETLLNITLYHIDTKNIDCLYVLPSKTPDAGEFSSGRFDTALEASPYLSGIFSDVKNIGHKRAGSANLYIRGSRSRSGLKSIPVGFIGLDEVDEMTQENIPLALERTSGQITKLIWMISTPTLADFGINSYFKDSSQNHFYLKCPSCSRFILLEFPASLVITADDIFDENIKNSHLICTLCKNKLPHEEKINFLKDAQWIEHYHRRDIKGWHISQLYSTTIRPEIIARDYFLSFGNPTKETELYNSKLGLPHEVEGSRLTDTLIENAKGTYVSYKNNDSGLVTLGIDVGYPHINWEVDKWYVPDYFTDSVDINAISKCVVLAVGKVGRFEDLDEIIRIYNVAQVVIDSHPERRKALELANRHWGKVKLVFYGSNVSGKTIHVAEVEQTITVDRTSWIDLALGRFRSNTIKIPGDISQEYKAHLKALVRTYEIDVNGNPVARYIHAESNPDHYAHCRTYNEVALPLAVSVGRHQSMSSVL